MKFEVFADENYKERMDSEVGAWWKEHIRKPRYASYDGTKIQGYYALNPEAAHAIVLVHGFTEYTEKFSEILYYFYEEGYSVFMMDQRGHGRSGRKTDNPDLVYVDSFEEYVLDLKYFIERIVRKYAPDLPLFLYGHSMGGCISGLFLERYPDAFRAAVLTSPMLKIDFGSLPDPAVNAMATFSRIVNREKRPAPGAVPFSPKPDFPGTCATSEARYLYTLGQQIAHKAYRTCGATFGWVRAAIGATEQVLRNAALADLPILICQAGIDTLVDNAGQEVFAANAPDARIVRFPTSKHEIYRSPKDVLEVYMKTVLGFLEEHKEERK